MTVDNNDTIEIEGMRVGRDLFVVYDTLSLHGIPTINSKFSVWGYLLKSSVSILADWQYGYVTMTAISQDYDGKENGLYSKLDDLKNSYIIQWIEYDREINGEIRHMREYQIPRLLYLESKVNKARKFFANNSPSITRQALIMRDNHCCVYCGTTITLHNMTIDHIFPRCKGGKTEWQNIVASCKKCNSLKGNKNLNDFLKEFPSLNQNIRAFVPQRYVYTRAKKKTRTNTNKISVE